MAVTVTGPAERTLVVSQPLEVAGRVLYGTPYALFGATHLSQASDMAGIVPTWVPGGGTFWVMFTGVAMLAASICILTNQLTRLAGVLLAALLAVYVFALHVPAYMDGNPMELASILKNVALMGGALLVAARGR